MVVESAFGLLKNKFRILKRTLEEKSIARTSKTIVTPLVLHNILINLESELSEITSECSSMAFDDEYDMETLDDNSSYIPEAQHRDEINNRAINKAKRNEIATLFFAEYIV